MLTLNRGRSRAAVIGGAIVGAAMLALSPLAMTSSAHAAFGVFIWSGPDGDTPVFSPEDDQCITTPGATGAQNFTIADAFFFEDDSCTIGREAGHTGAMSTKPLAFESVQLRTPAN